MPRRAGGPGSKFHLNENDKAKAEAWFKEEGYKIVNGKSLRVLSSFFFFEGFFFVVVFFLLFVHCMVSFGTSF